ncbi:DUF4097 family beta strand repeat-containing protein [Kribbella albertanoniae]|uniref:DUF4097 domain-containing protein n=1 Tax=Kribbella albertanoniae TaxID=1266829 RepID=A0A4R4QA08_9ACTN|nr:DUF4097 family beta strand repeat-containing protein [Kribbella albertanoniae]TDC32090.1 hypothetical protein E1261_09295 [Kribbella albertanoniae]
MYQFDTPAPITVVADIPAGRVRFVATERGDTVVDVRPANASKGRDVEVAEQTTVEYADGVVRIEAVTMNRIFGSSGSIEVTVQLPVDSTVEAKAAAAGFRTDGRLGDVTFDGAYGEVVVDEAAGVRLTALAGDISVGRLSGDAEITTSKGDIRIGEAVRGNVVVRTQSGNLSVQAAHGVSASLDAGTTYGRIENSLKNADGTPELTIHATTAHGDISARSL